MSCEIKKRTLCQSFIRNLLAKVTNKLKKQSVICEIIFTNASGFITLREQKYSRKLV